MVAKTNVGEDRVQRERGVRSDLREKAAQLGGPIPGKQVMSKLPLLACTGLLIRRHAPPRCRMYHLLCQVGAVYARQLGPSPGGVVLRPARQRQSSRQNP